MNLPSFCQSAVSSQSYSVPSLACEKYSGSKLAFVVVVVVLAAAATATATAVTCLIKLEKYVISSYGCGSYTLSNVPEKTVKYQFF